MVKMYQSIQHMWRYTIIECDFDDIINYDRIRNEKGTIYIQKENHTNISTVLFMKFMIWKNISFKPSTAESLQNNILVLSQLGSCSFFRNVCRSIKKLFISNYCIYSRNVQWNYLNHFCFDKENEWILFNNVYLWRKFK